MTEAAAPEAAQGFQVRLSNFEGPFDLLLQLIFAHRLDVTEVALHQVSGEFIAYTKEIGRQLELDETTAFLVIAATLLDLKAARLLPSGEVHDEEDLALLEVRDLLFARLLQYRAFKQVAEMFAELEAAALRSYPRAVSLEPQFDQLLPEVMLGVDADRFAQIAATAFTPRQVPTVRLDHLHIQSVSVPEQAKRLMGLLELRGVGEWASFSELVADCADSMEIVGRFLALLELYRVRAVAFEQVEPLGVLQVSWTGDRPTNEHLAAAVEEDFMTNDVTDTEVGVDPALESEAEPVTEVLDDADFRSVLEALLLVVDTPVTVEALASATDQPEDRVTATMTDMATELTERDSGIDLRETGGGWRMYTRSRYAPYVERLLLDGARSKLTRAALETLAVVAYRQPVTRARVSAVRGVNVDAVIRTLLARGLITEAGNDSDSGAVTFATTELFLERLGLTSLTDLPDIAPLLPDVDVIDDLSENLSTEPRFAKLDGSAAVPGKTSGFDVDKD